MAKFPEHFKEPIRIEMAVCQIQEQFRKLFPSVPLEIWPKIDLNIADWFFGEDFELEPIYDFWNFFGGISRELKMKSLELWITAENVKWQKKEIPISEIIMTWDFPGLEFMGRAPFKISDLIEVFSNPALICKKEELKKLSENRSKKYAPRDHFPITVFFDPVGGVINSYKGYYILDGNRRTVKAVIEDRKTISAYVGKFKSSQERWPRDFWLPTGMLRDLVFIAKGLEKNNDYKAFEVLRRFYQLLLRDFDVVRIATIEKTFKNFEKDERLLLDIILKDMNK